MAEQLNLFSASCEEKFSSVQTNKEFCEQTGRLLYVETIANIKPEYLHLFHQPNIRISPNGTHWCRIGENACYWGNHGKLKWRIQYDDFGKLESYEPGFDWHGNPIL